MAITQDELQSIINAVLSSIRTNSLTIGQLTPVTSLSDDDSFEINGGKRITYRMLEHFLMTRQEGNETDGIDSLSEIISFLSGIKDNEKLRDLLNAISTDVSENQDNLRKLSERLNTLISGNASEAIDSFNEIERFLSGLKDSERLVDKIAELKTLISGNSSKIEDLSKYGVAWFDGIANSIEHLESLRETDTSFVEPGRIWCIGNRFYNILSVGTNIEVSPAGDLYNIVDVRDDMGNPISFHPRNDKYFISAKGIYVGGKHRITNKPVFSCIYSFSEFKTINREPITGTGDLSLAEKDSLMVLPFNVIAADRQKLMPLLNVGEIGWCTDETRFLQKYKRDDNTTYLDSPEEGYNTDQYTGTLKGRTDRIFFNVSSQLTYTVTPNEYTLIPTGYTKEETDELIKTAKSAVLKTLRLQWFNTGNSIGLFTAKNEELTRVSGVARQKSLDALRAVLSQPREFFINDTADKFDATADTYFTEDIDGETIQFIDEEFTAVGADALTLPVSICQGGKTIATFPAAFTRRLLNDEDPDGWHAYEGHAIFESAGSVWKFLYNAVPENNEQSLDITKLVRVADDEEITRIANEVFYSDKTGRLRNIGYSEDDIARAFALDPAMPMERLELREGLASIAYTPLEIEDCMEDVTDLTPDNIAHARRIMDSWDPTATAVKITSANGWANDPKLVVFPKLDFSNVISISNAWNNCPNLAFMPDMDTSACTSFGYLYFNGNDYAVVPQNRIKRVPDWNLENATSILDVYPANMREMIFPSEIRTPKASMLRLFSCMKNSTFPLVIYDNTKVKSFWFMYAHSGIKHLPMQYFDDNVTCVDNIYDRCNGLTDLSGSCIVARNATATQLFQKCENITHLPFPIILGPTDMTYGFESMRLIEEVPDYSNIKIKNFDCGFCCGRGDIYVNDYPSSKLRKVHGIDFSEVTDTTFCFGCENKYGSNMTRPTTYVRIKNLGKGPATIIDLRCLGNWGSDDEGYVSLVESVVTGSYDRKTNGMPTATIRLPKSVADRLGTDNIALVTSKGYTISTTTV